MQGNPTARAVLRRIVAKSTLFHSVHFVCSSRKFSPVGASSAWFNLFGLQKTARFSGFKIGAAKIHGEKGGIGAFFWLGQGGKESVGL
jgi:hypothetical protein